MEILFRLKMICSSLLCFAIFKLFYLHLSDFGEGQWGFLLSLHGDTVLRDLTAAGVALPQQVVWARVHGSWFCMQTKTFNPNFQHHMRSWSFILVCCRFWGSLFLYFIIGYFWKASQGAEGAALYSLTQSRTSLFVCSDFASKQCSLCLGIERVPNISFWRELPGLVKVRSFTVYGSLIFGRVFWQILLVLHFGNEQDGCMYVISSCKSSESNQDTVEYDQVT